MKIYRIPEKLKTIIFDIDSTLYTSPEYAFEQVDCQVRHFADLRGISHEKARNMVSEYRKSFAEKNGGKAVSLGNTLKTFGIPIEESVKWRKELLEPKNFLSRDDKLIQVLSGLSENYRMICVTNNPVLPAWKTLEAIGIESLLPDIIGLDTCGKSKPAEEPFRLAAEKTGAALDQCISIGDRYDLDISLPLEMGMGGILVDGVKDVYQLPEILGM